jgi:hypothetical protein
MKTVYNQVSYRCGFPQKYVEAFQIKLQQTNLSQPINDTSQQHADLSFAITNVSNDLDFIARKIFDAAPTTNMLFPDVQAKFIHGNNVVLVECLNNNWSISFNIHQWTDLERLNGAVRKAEGIYYGKV